MRAHVRFASGVSGSKQADLGLHQQIPSKWDERAYTQLKSLLGDIRSQRPRPRDDHDVLPAALESRQLQVAKALVNAKVSVTPSDVCESLLVFYNLGMHWGHTKHNVKDMLTQVFTHAMNETGANSGNINIKTSKVSLGLGGYYIFTLYTVLVVSCFI